MKEELKDVIERNSLVPSTPKNTDERRVKTTVPAVVEPKQSFLTRFLKNFMQTDAETIKKNLLDDYIIPGIKDAVLGVIDMFFYENGEGGRGSDGHYVSYDKKYKNGDRRSRGDDQASPRQNRYDYRELCWPTRGKAENALNALWEILDEFGVVRVADIFDLAEVTPVGDSTGNNYGWRDLSGSSVKRTYDGQYSLDLPQAISLK